MGMCCSSRAHVQDYFIREDLHSYGSTSKTDKHTIACLARECGVSIATASKALEHDVLSDDIAKILSSLCDHSDLPPFAALAIRGANTIHLCKERAVAMITHRVCGDLDAADKLLHKMFSQLAPLPQPHDTTEAFECAVCYSQVEPGEGARLATCSHQFCTSCLSAHVESCALSNVSISNVSCIHSDCTGLLTEAEVRLICPIDALKTAMATTLDDLTARDPCLRRCPTPDCNFIFNFCTVRAKRAQAICPRCSQTTKQTAAQLLKEERAMQKMMKKQCIRRCARCGEGVQKSSGCNKLMCRCGYRFCYVCGVENAQCPHTPSSHGFIDNVTGHGNFRNLRDNVSPDVVANATRFKNSLYPRCKNNHQLELNEKRTKREKCSICKTKTAYFSCVADCKFFTCEDCYYKKITN